MQNKLVSLEIINDLQKANKYIFVQDFEKAEAILKNICQEHENEYEAYFRRVEIASKNNGLDGLLLDFLEQEKHTPSSKALELAYLLAQVKKHSVDKKKPSMKIERTKNVEIIFSNPEKVMQFSNKKLKLHRTVQFPDDTIQTLDVEAGFDKHCYENTDFDELIAKIFTYYKNDPENYAACYVAACALDYLGNLEEAIYNWKKALNLNSQSICTLSVLAELQQRGHFHNHTDDYCGRLENIDKYLVHGHIETHTDLYNDFMAQGDYRNAISSLKILSNWIVRQYGSVPIEIEVICLLGMMNAYKLDKNTVAFESCKNTVENVVIAYKKSTQDFKHLVFIAELCEEYEMKSLAKICYYSILSNKNVDVQILKNISSHCSKNYPSEALLINLKNAYATSKGDSHIRSCITQCSLLIKEINVEEYMVVKNKISENFSQNKIEESLLFFSKLSTKFQEDPEIYFYLAEIYLKKGLISKANTYFQLMYNLDKYNSDATVKYIYFLVKNKFYLQAIDISTEALTMGLFSEFQMNEIHWSLSLAYFAEEKYELAKQEIEKSIDNEPWNISYLSLYIKCCLLLINSPIVADAFILVTKLEDQSVDQQKIISNKKEDLVQSLMDYSSFCLQKGFFEIAWSFAKCSLALNKKMGEKISEILSQTAAAYLSHTTIPQLLGLLKKQLEIDISFFEITRCIAKTYSLIGQWKFVDEWLAMAHNNPFADKIFQSKLFELEAFSIVMQGLDLKRAQNFLEAAIDCYHDIYAQIPTETKILHGYVLVAQGNIAVGIEKMKASINENASIQNLYFFIKGLERAGTLSSLAKDSLEQMQRVYPINILEQKMVEEIFYTFSSKIDLSPLGLAC